MTPDPGLTYWAGVAAIFAGCAWAAVAHDRHLRRSGAYRDLERVERRRSRLDGGPRPLPERHR